MGEIHIQTYLENEFFVQKIHANDFTPELTVNDNTELAN